MFKLINLGEIKTLVGDLILFQTKSVSLFCRDEDILERIATNDLNESESKVGQIDSASSGSRIRPKAGHSFRINKGKCCCLNYVRCGRKKNSLEKKQLGKN